MTIEKTGKVSEYVAGKITFGQLFVTAATVASMVVMSWININTRIRALEIQVEVLQTRDTDSERFRERVLDKLELIQLKLENKADRK